MWDEANPHIVVESRRQVRFAVYIWSGIVDDNLIGPYLLPEHLNCHRYLRFLQRVLPELLQDVPLAVRKRMWIQHDGTASHQCGYLQQSQCCISWSLDWPARSPDLNPLGYFRWGYLKTLEFETPVQTEMELISRIVAACDVIQNTPGLFISVRQNLVRRWHSCIEIGGRLFEQLLQDTKWYVNCANILYFQVTVTNVNKKQTVM